MEAELFPTRTHPYRRGERAAGAELPSGQLAEGKLFRMRVGRDRPPGEEMSPAEQAALNDPFATLILRRGVFPTTLRALLAALDAYAGTPVALPQQTTFVVAEGGMIPFAEAPALRRGFRFVVARGRDNATPDLFVSTAAPFDSPQQFLQVLSWDEPGGAFQYYERRGGSWLWAGSSWDALEEDTRGKGPFDSHVNGSMVMKELRLPWLHWSSMSQTIPREALAPGDPLAQDPIFTGARGAEALERIVIEGVDRWTESRLSRVLRNGEVARPERLMRQVLTTTTVNIVSAPEPAAGPTDEPIRIPRSFFFNVRALSDLVGLQPQFQPPRVTRGRYLESARRLGLHLADPRQGFRREGDVFFAWATPEPAFEDLNLLARLLEAGVLSRRFAACLLMVDFCNPIGSARRESLMRHVPGSAATTGEEGLEARMVRSLEAAGEQRPQSPEAEFLEGWRQPDETWTQIFETCIATFMAAVAARLADDAGLDDLMTLADARRREFRGRPLAEFGLTLPRLDTPPDAPLLRLEPDGRVTPQS